MSGIVTQDSSRVLDVIRQLNQDGRARAYRSAKESLKSNIGNAPEQKHFANANISNFPRWFIALIYLGCLILLMAGFVPSAIRLFDVGSETFAKSIDDANSKIAVGYATILMAEIGQVIFVLALSALSDKASWKAKAFLVLLAIASASVAIVGNLQVVEPWRIGQAFAWVEALVPPLLVLGTAYVLKEQMLNAIQSKQLANEKFRVALQQWENAMQNLEKHPDWLKHYAVAILEQLRRENKSKEARSVLLELTPQQKHLLFAREQNADSWYSEAVEQPIALPEVAPVAIVSEHADAPLAKVVTPMQKQIAKSMGGGGHSTGEVDGAKMEIVNGLYFATCPHCQQKTDGKESELKAKRALAAHMKAHRYTAKSNVVSAANEVISNIAEAVQQ